LTSPDQADKGKNMINRKNVAASVVAVGFGAGMMLATPSFADVVHSDDTIVIGSLCAGLDCTSGLNFGFDTIVLRENNLRILFQDTSNSGSFPSRDWRLVANDSANGGAEYFAIDDVDGGRTPFRIEANSPSNLLYLDNGGRIGVKTSTPVVEMHIVDGDSPTVRLEQDGSSGFTPQTYDIAANETNFFIRDVTNGSRLFFRARPGAPENSIYIDATGKIGLGTNSPSESLHIRRTDGTATLLVQETNSTVALRNLLKMENNGDVGFRMENTDSNDRWAFATAAGRLTINANGGAGEFALDGTGNLVLAGSITTSGSCSIGCDAVFGPEYDILPIAERAEMMFDLGHLPNVGPTAEAGQYDLTQKVLGMLNELEHAHIYIAELNERIAVLEARLPTQD
jgi:hypothetical protein